MKVLSSPLVVSLCHLGLIRIAGKDAAKFLQGQLTCDVREITATHSSLGAYCNYKGRMLAIFRIFNHENNYYLQLPREILENTLTDLKKYAVFSKVLIEDASDDYIQLGIAGLAKEQINHLSGILIPIPTDRFEYIGKETAIVQEIIKQYDNSNLDQWRLLNIEAGIPSIYQNTREQFTPHMVNLPKLGGVSFNKGCYVGQEIIARTEYLGKSKRGLSQVFIATSQPPQPGEKLTLEDGREAGIVLEAAPQDNGYAVLVVGSF